MTFPDRLRFLMGKKAVTKYRVHKDLGFSQSAIANWLDGSVELPGGDNLAKLSEYFGVSVDFLLGHEVDEVSSSRLCCSSEQEELLLALFRSLPSSQKVFYLNSLQGAVSATKPVSVMPMYAVARGGKSDIEVTEESQRDAVNSLFDSSYDKGGKGK